MTTTGTINTKGFEEYLAAIVQLGLDVDEATAQAVLAGGEVLQGTMQDLAPVDEGNLRAHILIKGPDRDGNFIFVEIGIIRDTEFTDADTARYANAQEYGWNGQQHAHPYIRPGLAKGRGPARKATIDSLRGWLTR